ncbi:hypothetical protein NSU_3648 [Novosphingobium pentaromativorans US6-1]|uniref:Uncharacterized protein n=1 Tax=Novosphingobium pentaromativorans US6-1 TaxID=1088721 RepID=G6EH27_9SPHN|nr:hypothetical protein NSU_3648 [Novosphingobium pentaromativorans US6-1]
MLYFHEFSKNEAYLDERDYHDENAANFGIMNKRKPLTGFP